MLTDSTCYALDENMKNQGKDKSLDFLLKLSCINVNIPEFNYGSRCHTIVLIDKNGKVDFYEKSRGQLPEWKLEHITFNLVL